MNKKTWVLSGLTFGTAADVGYVLWKHTQRVAGDDRAGGAHPPGRKDMT